MENNDRVVEPGLLISNLQQLIAAEFSRFAVELSYREAYIQTLEERIKELQEQAGVGHGATSGD